MQTNNSSKSSVLQEDTLSLHLAPSNLNAIYSMVVTAEKASKLGYNQVTRLEACFVVVLLIFNNLSAEIFS